MPRHRSAVADSFLKKKALEAVEILSAPMESEVVNYIRGNTTARISEFEVQRISNLLQESCESGIVTFKEGRYRLPHSEAQSVYELGDVVRINKTRSSRRGINPYALYLVVSISTDERSNPYSIVNLDGHSKGRSAYSVKHEEILGLVRKQPNHPWIWDQKHKLQFRVQVGKRFFDWTPYREQADV